MYRSRIPQITAKLDAEMKAAEKAAAELVANAAKERVPVNTGRLRDAIHVEQQDGGAAVVAGDTEAVAGDTEAFAGDTEAFYGHIVEHGSVHTPAHPFLVPALEASREEALAVAVALLRSL